MNFVLRLCVLLVPSLCSANNCIWEPEIITKHTLKADTKHRYDRFIKLLNARLITDLEELAPSAGATLRDKEDYMLVADLGGDEEAELERFERSDEYAADYLKKSEKLLLVFFKALATKDDEVLPPALQDVAVSSKVFLGHYRGTETKHYIDVETSLTAKGAADYNLQYSIALVFSLFHQLEERQCELDYNKVVDGLKEWLNDLPENDLIRLGFLNSMKPAVQRLMGEN